MVVPNVATKISYHGYFNISRTSSLRMVHINPYDNTKQEVSG